MLKNVYKKNLLFCFIIFLCNNSNSQSKNEIEIINIDSNTIISTGWVYDVADDCQDYILFKEDKQYEEYICETGDTLLGTYKLNGNIITLYQQKSVYEEDFPIDSEHRSRPMMYKLEIKNEKMFYIEMWEMTRFGEWKELQIPENYFLYQKTQ